MSRLNQSQRAVLLDVQQSLERREIVVLKGEGNGRTRIAYEVQEAIATPQPDGSIRTERRHAENSQIEFINTIHWGRSDKVSDVSILRQVLAHAGEKVPMLPADVTKRGLTVLKEYRAEGRVLCFVVDNAETLCANAFSVMRRLNELRDTKERRAIGPAILIAGQWYRLSMKGVGTFMLHATEIRVGKITQQEIGELIEVHYPTESLRFDEQALRKLATLEKTVDVHRAVRRAVQKRRENRKTTVTLASLELVLAGE